MSSKAEGNAKSVEEGTCEAGHQSNLSGGGSSAQEGKFFENKVWYYAQIGVILCTP